MTPTADRSDTGAGRSQASFSVVNRSVPRFDGYAKVTGRAAFAGDIISPRMAYARILRSPHANARIIGFDVSRALERPGVLAVVDARDCEMLTNPLYGHALRDHPVLAMDEVRFAGEPVAVVVADDELTAQMALGDVAVRYEPLPAVITTQQALAEGAPTVHSASYVRGRFAGVPGEFDAGSNNICYHEHIEWGNVEEGFRAASRSFEGEYVFPLAYAYAMEPYVATAEFSDRGHLTVVSSTQHPYMVRSDLCSIFGLPLNKVRVQVPYVGGGYGSKSYTKIEPLAALCARVAQRPVRLQLSVEEAILTTRVAGARMSIRTGFDGDGTIVAREATLLFDGGAYAENGPLGASKSAERVLGPYRVPNARVDSYLIYTNTAPSSSFRGFGTTQATMASETQLDEAARALGIDRLAIRSRNLVAKGERVHGNARPLDGDLAGDMELAAKLITWKPDTVAGGPSATGAGIALMAMGAGAYPVSTAEVRVHADDSVSVYSGSTEIGQGSETVIAQIVAESLGLALDRITVVRSDTGITPFERSTGASRSTTLQGRALLEACRDAVSKMRAMATEVTRCEESDIHEVPGGFMVNGSHLGWGAIITRYFGIDDCEVIGIGHVRRAGDLTDRPAFWEVSCVGIRVEVDAATGRVRITDLGTVADVGLAIHPAMMEGQDLGSAVQGFGISLFEELLYVGEKLTTKSLMTYHVPRMSDVPKNVRQRLVENRDGVGPFGAKGGGEGAISAIAPAVLSAVHDATGVWIREIPLTPERVWRALQGR